MLCVVSTMVLPLGVVLAIISQSSRRLRIEPGARLVEEQHLRIVHHCPRDRQTLHHAAGKPARTASTTQTRIDALVSRDDFLLEPGIAHLCAGGETPILRSHAAAVERFFADKSQGMAGRMTGLDGTAGTHAHTRRGAAGRAGDDVAFLGFLDRGHQPAGRRRGLAVGRQVVVRTSVSPRRSPLDTAGGARRGGARGAPVGRRRQPGAAGRRAGRPHARAGRGRISFLTGRRYELAELAAITPAHQRAAVHRPTHAPASCGRGAPCRPAGDECYEFLLAVHGVALSAS